MAEYGSADEEKEPEVNSGEGWTGGVEHEHECLLPSSWEECDQYRQREHGLSCQKDQFWNV